LEKRNSPGGTKMNMNRQLNAIRAQMNRDIQQKCFALLEEKAKRSNNSEMNDK